MFFFLDFQNFLRTQMGNTTTVNIIISTVDYLLRLQVINACSLFCALLLHVIHQTASLRTCHNLKTSCEKMVFHMVHGSK